jgi:hypothetical protein
MGRPRKWRPPPRPVGRPRKPVDLSAKLAKMSEAELIELERYQQAIIAPKARYRMGDVHPTNGKVFLRYIPYWITAEQYEKEKKRLRDYMHKRAVAAEQKPMVVST